MNIHAYYTPYIITYYYYDDDADDHDGDDIEKFHFQLRSIKIIGQIYKLVRSQTTCP